MNNIGGKEIDTPDSLRAERDALRAVLREIVTGCRDRYDPETDFGGVWAAAIERAEELCK